MSKTSPELRAKNLPVKHELKTFPGCFREIVSGVKNFELRKNDRMFQVGDYLLLREYNPDTKQYTGNQVVCEVRYILNKGFGLKKGYCAMAISPRQTSPARYTRAAWRAHNR